MGAPSGVRLVARRFLKDADRAAIDLSDSTTDPEALRHTRVALRRLRSWLRAFKDDLRGTIRREDRRALHSIAAATNLVRDLDVQLEWLNGTAKGWRGKRRTEVQRHKRELTARHRVAANALDGVLVKFGKIREELDARLFTVRKPARRAARAQSLASAIVKRLKPHSRELGDALDEVESVEDEIPAHKARIAAKRLRYLLEPAVPYVKKGRALFKRIKSLQDELGALHDAHVMRKQLLNTLKPSDTLNTLTECVDEDAQAAFDRMERHWLDGKYKKFSQDVSAFAKRLKRLKG